MRKLRSRRLVRQIKTPQCNFAIDTYLLFFYYCSVTQWCLIFWDPMSCSTPGSPFLHYLLELAQIHIYWVSDAIQLSCPLFSLLLLPSISPSISVFSNELALHIRWWKYWIFSFSISPSSEYSGLISFRIDWPAPPQLEVLPVAVLQCFVIAWHRRLCPRDHHDLLWQKLMYLSTDHQNWAGVYQKTSK